MFRVDEAGRRDPCLDKRSRAGGQFGLWGGGGVRYSERSVWYIEGVGSSGSEEEVETRRDWSGEESAESAVIWT
jgi:hypothetical protein